MVIVKNKHGRVIKPKGITLTELSKVNKLVGLSLFDTPTRQRPRNPNEAKMLKQWESERNGVKHMAETSTKQTISAKVPAELKRKVKADAAKQGINVSEYIARILSTDWSAKEETHQLELNDLKEQLKAKDDLINRLTEGLEREQKLVDQQQQLQLQSQQRVKELEEKQQLLIESKSSRKWWQIWGRA